MIHFASFTHKKNGLLKNMYTIQLFLMILSLPCIYSYRSPHMEGIYCFINNYFRGLVAVEFLKELEKKTGRRTYELFDYACGVSTGALLVTLICLYKLPLER